MKILAIITARGGSKGIPRKNITELAGRPLLEFTAKAALASQLLSRVILSTDDLEIAEVGKSCGLEVPFLRPPELALDSSPTLPVLQHAVGFLEKQGDLFDAICLLQPTNPFRRTEDIDGCIELMVRSGADAIVTVLPVPHEHNPHWVYEMDTEGFLHLATGESQPIVCRQALPPAFHREGSVYITKRHVLMELNSLYGSRLLGYVMDRSRSVNIDGPADLAKAAELATTLLEESSLGCTC